MVPFVYENEILFCLAMIAYILAMVMGIICFAMSIFYKLKLQYVLPELFIIASSIFLFCYLSDGISIRYFDKDPLSIDTSLCFMPSWSVILIAVILLLFAILCLVLIIKKRLSTITAMSIKEAISKLPVGLCFFEENGRVLLLNEQISRDCIELTGEPLYDGNSFYSSVYNNKVKDSFITKSEDSLIIERNDGRVSMCKRFAHNIDGKLVYEICNMDISREFALKNELVQKNNDLQKMKTRLLKYGEIVSEVTKEKEILAARINVHSNFGSLIVKTKKELMNKEHNFSSLINAWKEIISLIFIHDDEGQVGFAKANKTAESIGVDIIYNGQYPKNGSQVEKIFAQAVFECAINTVRHADGTILYVTMTENNKGNSITLSNNGKQPTKDIKEGGGLSNLRTMVENVGGTMKIVSVPKFILTINIQKKDKKNE